jgi:hypothetical protein
MPEKRLKSDGSISSVEIHAASTATPSATRECSIAAFVAA